MAAFEKLQNFTPEQTFDVKDIYKDLKNIIKLGERTFWSKL